MSLVDEYISSIGLVFNDVMNNIVEGVSTEYFPNSHVEFWTATIPAKTDDYDLAYLEFPSNVFIRSFQNLVVSRLDDVLCRIEEVLTPIKKVSKIEQEVPFYTMAYHGNGILINRQDDEFEITIKTVCVDISQSTLNYSVLALIKNLYYHLLTGNFGQVYRDLQAISEERKNVPASNVKNRPIRKQPNVTSNNNYRM